MGSVDNRVVSLKFDNDDFQKKIGPTLQNLDNLKKGLDLSESSKNLEGLSKAGKGFNLDNIGSAVESISNKFTAMGAVAFSVIDNIVTKAITAGSSLASAFSLDPIKDGFKEFEVNANSIQTILANTADKGTTLNQVTDALDNLNEYADKTIYNFSQMAKNIGTFTAAGVNLEDAKNSIKGIANLAAMAGSSADQASAVMYQLSQAMSAGKVSAQDWLSVNNAGIGGPLQKQLFESAKALHQLNDVPLNTTFDEWVKSGGNFKQAMEDGVFTSDVLKLALKAMSGEMSKDQLVAAGYSEQQAEYVLKTAGIAEDAATKVKTFTQLMSTVKEALGSGWAMSFKLIIGNFEEAKGLFTSLNNVFSGLVQNSAKQRNEMLNAWRDSGGRDAAIQSLRNILWSLFSVIEALKQGWREIFPKMTGTRLTEITQGFEKLTQKLIPSAETLEHIKSAFSGVASVLKLSWTIITSVAGAFKTFFLSIDAIKGPPGATLGFFAKLGDGLKRLNELVGNGDWLKSGIEKLLGPVAEFINGLGSKIQPALDWLINTFNKVKDFLSNFFSSGADGAKSGFSSFADGVEESTGRIRQRWDQLMSHGDTLKRWFESFKEGLKSVAEWFKGFAGAVKESLSKGDFNSVFDKLNTGLLGGLLVVLGKFAKDGLKLNFGGKFLDNLGELIKTLSSGLKTLQLEVKADIIKKIAVAIAILTASVLVLSLIDSASLTKALGAIASFFAELVITFRAFDKLVSGVKGAFKIAELSAALILIGIALLAFVSAIKTLGSMSAEELAKGIAGLTVLLSVTMFLIDGLVQVLKKFKKGAGPLNKELDPKDLIALGLGLIGIAFAVKIMAGAAVELSKLPLEKMAQGIGGVLFLLGGIALVIKVGDDKKYLSMGLGMIAVAYAIKVLFGVVEDFANMDFEKMSNGILGLAETLAVIALSVRLLPEDTPKIGLGIYVLVKALKKMVDVIKEFAAVPTEDLVKGLIAMGVALGIIAAVIKIIGKDALEGMAALAITVLTLWALYGVIKAFAEIGLGGVLIGLLAIVGVIAALTIASVALTETGAVLGLMGLAEAFVAIGASVLLAGLGVLAFGAGILLLVKAAQLFQEIGVTAIRTFLDILPEIASAGAKAFGAFLASLLEMIPTILSALGDVIKAIAQWFSDNIDSIVSIITSIIQAILKVLRDNVPTIIQVGLELLIALLTGIRDNIYQITMLVGDILINFFNALNEKAPELIDSGMQLLETFLTGIADNLWKLSGAVGYLIGEFIRYLGNVLWQVVDAGGDVIVHLIEGFGKKAGDIVGAATVAIIIFAKELANNALKLADAAGTILTQFLRGLAQVIRTRGQEIRDAGLDLALAIIDGMTGGLATNAFKIIDKLKEIAKDGWDALTHFWESHSPSKKTYRLGVYIAEGLAKGLSEDTQAASSATTFAENVYNRFNDALTKSVDLSSMISESNPTITPVVDLSNVKKSMNDIDSLVGSPTIDTSVSLSQASSLASATKALENASADTNNPLSVPTSKEFKFEQNIYSPKALNMSDIYRQTRSQLAFAKEGLEELANELN